MNSQIYLSRSTTSESSRSVVYFFYHMTKFLKNVLNKSDINFLHRENSCLNFKTECASRWWSHAGSNRRPPACKAGALPAELWPHNLSFRRLLRCVCHSLSHIPEVCSVVHSCTRLAINKKSCVISQWPTPDNCINKFLFLVEYFVFRQGI